MTAEEIRAEAIERIARAEWAEHHRAETVMDKRAWASERPAFRDTYRRWAARMVDALGDLLPTGEEISTSFPDEPAADDGAMHRYVTDWKEMQG
ncbi:hypothetical protein GV792_04785 [Nocardia cyriacigeorgica]|uniref:hypothetical protein n=1 Tax=Nocardia cyriacigeorgica TaxID=135487 RepID=UPI0013B905CD|nr:hypothetical protein [Nocardia cyriacigeorgica]NEW49359.1 hypothetical protein [Nocardia cyriacigeorgica]